MPSEQLPAMTDVVEDATPPQVSDFHITWAQLRNQVCEDVWPRVGEQVWQAVWDQVRAVTESQVRDEVWVNILPQVWTHCAGLRVNQRNARDE